MVSVLVLLYLEIKELIVDSNVDKELISSIRSQKIPVTIEDSFLTDNYNDIYSNIDDDRIIKSIYDYGLSIPVNDVENDEYLGEINVDNIENAAKLMFEKYPKYFANILKEEEDVDTSDIWFQLVVMQEVVYG